ncbi:hypothetical protein FVER14953_20896 [Fusarium verticillioides]|nr:hypothetical protein FVER14953_20896 [Fusarium verticillioides]
MQGTAHYAKGTLATARPVAKRPPLIEQTPKPSGVQNVTSRRRVSAFHVGKGSTQYEESPSKWDGDGGENGGCARTTAGILT